MNSKGMAFGAVVCAVTVIMLLFSSMLSTMKLASFFMSTVMMCALIYFCGVKYALISYAASSLLLFIVVPDKMICLSYALFFGNYAAVKHFIERINKKALVWFVKIVCACIYAFVTYFVFSKLFADFQIGINLVLLFLAFLTVFVLGDILLDGIMRDVFSRIPFRSDKKWH